MWLHSSLSSHFSLFLQFFSPFSSLPFVLYFFFPLFLLQSFLSPHAVSLISARPLPILHTPVRPSPLLNDMLALFLVEIMCNCVIVLLHAAWIWAPIWMIGQQWSWTRFALEFRIMFLKLIKLLLQWVYSVAGYEIICSNQVNRPTDPATHLRVSFQFPVRGPSLTTVINLSRAERASRPEIIKKRPANKSSLEPSVTEH